MTDESASVASVVRFGVFEIDLRTGELRKRGFKVKLQNQPAQILAALLERPGELVTREALQKRLWSPGTFVDVDHSLNASLNKLREALGDSAENPSFIETIGRRGYRFLIPLGAPPSQASTNEAVPVDTDKLFRLLVESVSEYAICMVDIGGNIRTWNPGAERMTGYHDEEIVGQHFSCLYPSEGVPSGTPQQLLQLAAQQGQTQSEGWRARKDGSRFCANELISAMRDAGWNLLGFSILTREIAEVPQNDRKA